jgi:hypothetical protein
VQQEFPQHVAWAAHPQPPLSSGAAPSSVPASFGPPLLLVVPPELLEPLALEVPLELPLPEPLPPEPPLLP